MYRLKVRKIGNSVGVIVPKEVLDKLRVKEGDELFAADTPDGLHLTPYRPDSGNTMKLFERTRRKLRNAFRELAK